jgi:TolA-binding protein
MGKTTYRTVLLGATLLVSACAFTEEALWPSLTGEDPAGRARGQAAPAREARTAQAAPVQPMAMPAPTAQPPLGTTVFQPSGVTPGTPTGTEVGRKINDMREELRQVQGSISTHNTSLQQIRAKIIQDSQRYHGTIAAVNARLQIGTTPGNPILIQQFNSAQTDIEKLHEDVGEMNKLATDVAGTSTKAAFLSESSRATRGVAGAVDEDHRQLSVLEDEVDRTVVLIDRLIKEVSTDVRRQTNYIAGEKANLNTVGAAIKTGEIYGASLGQIAKGAQERAHPVAAGEARDPGGRRPLVVIRFDRTDVPYQQALYSAVSRVLERRPDAVFDLIAVAPAVGGAAREAVNTNRSRRHAENVLRSLVEMGLPPSRVAISTRTLAEAKVNEVHLYLR